MQRTHSPGSSRRSGSRWWALLLITLLVGLQVATAKTAEAATVQVSPSQVEPGGQIEISGGGFAAGEVRLCLDGERCSNLGSAEVVGGEFSANIQVEGDTGLGQHTLSACQHLAADGWTCAGTSLQVVAPTTTPPPTTTAPTTTAPTTTAPTTTAPTTTAPTTTAPPATAPPTTPPTTTVGPDTITTTPPGRTVTPGAPPTLNPGEPVDEVTTTSTAQGDTTTTRDEVVTAAPGSGPPSPPPPDGSETSSPVASGGDRALLGLGLADWALVAVAVALAVLILWLVDRVGTGRRRARHTFLAGARGGRR